MQVPLQLKPSGGERLIWGDGDAALMPVFDTEIGRLGGLQCWEHWVPMNLQAMCAKNEQVHVSSWPAFVPGDEALTSEAPNEISAHYYALATQTFVVSPTQIHTQEIDEAMGHLPPYSAFVEFGGGNACIIAPSGKILTEKLPRNEEGIVYAQIDLLELVDCKYQIDPAGHYSNQGIRMIVDESSHRPTTFTGKSPSQFLSFDDLQDEEN